MSGFIRGWRYLVGRICRGGSSRVWGWLGPGSGRKRVDEAFFRTFVSAGGIISVVACCSYWV